MNQSVALDVSMKNTENEIKIIEFNEKLLPCTTVIAVYCDKLHLLKEAKNWLKKWDFLESQQNFPIFLIFPKKIRKTSSLKHIKTGPFL